MKHASVLLGINFGSMTRVNHDVMFEVPCEGPVISGVHF
jgi:hypothetical protein